VRTGLRAIAASLVERPGGCVDLARRPEVDDLPGPRLLGPFDPLLLGWESRAFVVGDHAGVVTRNGVFRPVALVGGRAAGLWRWERGEVRLAPFAPLDPEAEAALAAEGADVARFLAGHAPRPPVSGGSSAAPRARGSRP
jgi:Winged helix DNA-binding domain